MFVENPQLTILTGHDLLDIREPKWLIDKCIHLGEIGAFWGKPSSGKSFMALDWALSIAAGIPWQGFQTKQGPVLYLAGEGGFSLGQRVRSWMRARHVSFVPPVYYMIEPISLREDEALDSLEHALEDYYDGESEPDSIHPQLIVVDTLSQFFGSGDEVGPEMRDFIENIRRISKAHNSAVLVVHHANATGGRERGHSALRGNVDVMFKIDGHKKDGLFEYIKMTNDKQRDAQEMDALYFQPVLGMNLPSLVFEITEAPEQAEKRDGPPVPMRKQDMLTVLAQHADGLTPIEWRLACAIDRDRFNKRLNRLKADGEVIKDGGKYYVMPANIDLANTDDD